MSEWIGGIIIKKSFLEKAVRVRNILSGLFSVKLRE